MADAQTTDSKSFGSKAWDATKTALVGTVNTVGTEIGRGVSDVGATFQACLWSGWHTQSVSIDSPELIAEQITKAEQDKKLEPVNEGPKVGLEKD